MRDDPQERGQPRVARRRNLWLILALVSVELLATVYLLATRTIPLFHWVTLLMLLSFVLTASSMIALLRQA
jgi:hypothetical protein